MILEFEIGFFAQLQLLFTTLHLLFTAYLECTNTTNFVAERDENARLFHILGTM